MPAEPGAARAVLTETAGRATLLREGRRVEPVSLPTLLLEGDRLRLPRQGSAVVVCSGDQARRLLQGTVVDAELCSGGVPLPAGAFEALVPEPGRARRVPGSERAVRSTRDLPSEYGRVPVVLSPRATSIASRHPRVRWTEVPGAEIYAVEWRGLGLVQVDVKVDELRCSPDPEIPRGLVTCSIAWPETWGLLEPDSRYRLRVHARLAGEWKRRVSKEPNSVYVLSEETARRLDISLKDLARTASAVGELTAVMVRGGLLLDYGLFGEAASAYSQAARLERSPTILVTLGDTYRSIRLFHFARQIYEEALGAAQGPAESAAAEFGLGHVLLAWGDFGRSADSFQRADQLFRAAGMFEQAHGAAAARRVVLELRPVPGATLESSP